MVGIRVTHSDRLSRRSISRSLQTTAQGRAKMYHPINTFSRKCANVLPSPPESPSMYAYPPAPGEHGRYITRMASRHILPGPSSSAAFGSAESEKASPSQYQENRPRDGRTPPRPSSLHQISTVENSNSVTSNMKASELPSPNQPSDHLQREDTSKQRPTRASSTATHPPPQLVLTEAEHHSGGDELYTGSEEEEDVAAGTEIVKSGAERLAEKRKMKRFRSAPTSSHQ